MNISRSSTKNATFLTLVNKAGLSVTLCDYGAALYELRWYGVPLTIAEEDRERYLGSGAYFGKSVGRLAGRVPSGILSYEGRDYRLNTNENGSTLHGGSRGFSFQHFETAITQNPSKTCVEFTYDSPDGEMGFPGTVAVKVIFSIPENEASLDIRYEATSRKATPLNLTCHTYFNLGGDETVEGQRLWISSHETETYDAEMMPLKMQPSPSYLDFSKEKMVGQDLCEPALQKSKNKGYDHCYKLAAKAGEPVLTLKNKGLELDLYCSAPCLQVYSDNYPRFQEPLTNGHLEGLHSGLALEPVYEPLDYKSMTVEPGMTQISTIRYLFKKEQ